MRYLVVGQHSWNRYIYETVLQHYEGEWTYFGGRDPDYLLDVVTEIDPDKIFFLHWSHIVPQEITANYECVCFHPSHLPYGRGGTPVQNLILQGFTETKLTAFRMVEEVDAGPIYAQLPLSLEGTAQYIYTCSMILAATIIETLVQKDVQPTQQSGEVTKFKRRTFDQSELPKDAPPDMLYDYIRMLSAEGYPFAFIDYGDYVIEFCDPCIDDDTVTANAIFIRNPKWKK